MIRTLFLIASGALLAVAPSAWAHHSFAVDYLESESVSVEGEITEFRYRNPHAIVMLQAPDEQGKMVVYAAEWAGAGRLGGQGITADTLKPGDRVKIDGAPGRNPADHKIHLKQIERPSDGWKWGNNRGRRR